VERQLDEPKMRRVLKDPLYGPLASRADTSVSVKGCALPAKEWRRRLPAAKRRRKRKKCHLLVDPTPKINLAETHLKRPFLQEKGR
jgi:hypothetical protein